MINRYFPETVVDGCSIIAQVAIMGAKRGTGWRFSEYLASKKFKSGYKFIRCLTYGAYPNKYNNAVALKYIDQSRKDGHVVVFGRPIKNFNAPDVK